MPTIGLNEEEFLIELAEAGEDRVRRNLGGGWYSENNGKAGLAREWLRRIDQSRADELASKQIAIAQSARNAAWTAALVAIIATLVAVVAVLFGDSLLR